jgi:hypothetical protein
LALPTGVGRVVVAGTLTRDGQGAVLVQYEIPHVLWCVENKAPLKPIQHVSRFLLKLCYMLDMYRHSISVQYANCNWVCAQGNTTKGDGGWPISWSDIGLYQPKLPHEMGGGRVHSRFHYHYFPPMEGRIYRGRERASCMNQCCWMLVLVVYTPVGNGVYVCTGT